MRLTDVDLSVGVLRGQLETEEYRKGKEMKGKISEWLKHTHTHKPVDRNMH